jgi:hypothetical protein
MTKRPTKKDKADWFDSHVIVLGPSADFEDKMRAALKNKPEAEKRQIDAGV